MAGTFSSDPEEDGKAFYSVDAGLTWKEAKHEGWRWKGRIDLAYARARPDVVYASVAASRDQDKPYLGTIFRSLDGGQTYLARATLLCTPGDPDCEDKGKDYLSGNGDYCNALWAGDPQDPDFLLVGGTDLRRSRDGGDTLEAIPKESIDVGDQTFCDHHAMIEDPSSRGGSLSVFVVNDGGVFRSEDVKTQGASVAQRKPWRPFNEGYGTVQFYSASGDPASGVIVGGAQDNDVFFSKFGRQKRTMDKDLCRRRRCLCGGPHGRVPSAFLHLEPEAGPSPPDARRGVKGEREGELEAEILSAGYSDQW